jgi:hypothetical protein
MSRGAGVRGRAPALRTGSYPVFPFAPHANSGV